MLKKMLLIFSILIISKNAYSAPVISSASGSIVHDGTVVLGGTSFGSHADNSVVSGTGLAWVWDNAEDFATPAAAGWVDVRPRNLGDERDLQYSGEYSSVPQAHTNSTEYARGIHNGADAYSGANVGLFTSYSSTFTNFYLRFYYYEKAPFTELTSPISEGDYDIRNNKNIVLQSGDTMYGGGGTGISYAYIDNDNLAVYDTSWTQTWGIDDWFRQVHINGFGSASGDKYGSKGSSWPAGNWELWEMQGYVTTSGTSSFKLWIDGVQQMDFTSTDFPFDLKGLGVGGFRDRSNSANFIKYFDDIYMDRTWSRVILGDNSTFASCTKKEIQIPTAWSASEVTASLNLGSFAAGEQAYLYVVDSTGSVSNAYPVTIGSTPAPVITNITGTVGSGQTVVISGVSLGTKSTPAPIKFENFEDGADGADVSSTGYWSQQNSADGYVKFSDTDNRTNSGVCVKTLLDNGTRNLFQKDGITEFNGLSQKIFVGFWMYLNEGTGDADYQIKMWRLCNDPQPAAIVNLYPSLAAFYWTGGTGKYMQVTKVNGSEDGGAADSGSGDPTFWAPTGRWFFVEAEVLTSSAEDTADGTYKIWHEGHQQCDSYNHTMFTNANRFDAIRFGEDHPWDNDTTNGNNTNYFDDIYIDNSWARVVLGNSNTWGSCSRKEMQLPTAWSSTEVSITVNTGAFVEGDNAYLYLVDDNGNVSDPYPVTIGATGDTGGGSPGIPSISNTSADIIDGTSINITGNYFGEHADYGGSEDYLPVKWKDFEDASFTSGGWEIKDNLTNEWEMVAGGRTNSSYYAKREYVATKLAALRFTQSNDQTGTYYTSFYFMMPALTQSGKFWRWYWGDNPSRDNWFVSSGYSKSDKNRCLRGNSESKDLTTQWSSPNSFGNGTWHRVEILGVYTGPDTGTVTTWMDGRQQWTRSDWFDGGIYNPAYKLYRIAEMFDSPYDYNGTIYDGSYNFDDIYYSYTQARVEIGNANTFASCTKRELQIPTAWSDTSITVNVNTGAFNNGDPAYLYVINESGEVSDPLTITIGPTTTDPNVSSVTGTIGHGNTVAVNGINFGNKSPAAPFWYDDFEEGSNGVRIRGTAPVVGTGTWSDYVWISTGYEASAFYPQYSSDYNPTNSTKVAKMAWYDTASYNQTMCALRSPAFSGGSDEIYIYYKRYAIESVGPTSGKNIKQYYIKGTGNLLPQGIWFVPAGLTTYRYGDNFSGEGGDLAPSTSLPHSDTDLEWQVWETYNKLEVPYTATNAIVKEWWKGSLIINVANWLQRSTNDLFSFLELGNMYDMKNYDNNGVAYAYFDNVYVDTTQARVMIGDSPTWEASTTREIQIPTSWSDSSIEITFNQGEKSAGQTVYLWVVDENGIISDENTSTEDHEGFPIVIGAAVVGTDTTIPAIENLSPANGATGIALTSDISFSITDTGSPASGVDISSIQLTVGGNDESADLDITGSDGDTSVSVVLPNADLDITPANSDTVSLNIVADDLSGNGVDSSYSFTFVYAPVETPVVQFCAGEYGNTGDYTAIDQSRWQATDEAGNIVYSINTTDYNGTAGSAMGELVVNDNLNTNTYWEIQCDIRLDDNLSVNAFADACIVFNYIDSANYDFVNFNADYNYATSISTVDAGIRTQLEWYGDYIIRDNNFHTVKVRYQDNNLVVYFEDTEIMRIDNYTCVESKIGFGSYNDSASFDNITLTSLDPVIGPPAGVTNIGVEMFGNVRVVGNVGFGVSAVPAGEVTAVFQQGTDGYTGCEDTQVREIDIKYGSDTGFSAKDSHATGYDRVAFIRFDLSSIPTSVTVVSAKLEMNLGYVADATTVYMYECLRPWVEDDCDYDEYNDTANLEWDSFYGRTDGVDMVGTAGYSTGAIASNTITDLQEGLIEYSGAAFTSYIQTKITAGEEMNVTLHEDVSGTNDGIQYASSEYSSVADRPKLTIVYTY